VTDYDYVVVGAGSAGCAVAARLAAASHTVLLIEAGGSDFRIAVRAPLAYGAQMGGPTDRALETEPEPGCDGRRIPQPRGKVLGGTSAMNAMVWVRGTRLDYDGWQVPGWGWDDVEPVFRRIESESMRVTRVAEPDEVSRRFVAAARAAGVAANDDVSGPDLDGAAISPVTVWRGRRWSTARGYLDSARRRSNFSVVTGALVHRIIVRDGAAIGVEYERRGRRHVATADREIVLSAGAFGTPQLLQLSGIGPAEHLRSVGITPVVDSPQVGQNLTDHPATFMNWELAPGFIGLADASNPKWLLRWLIRRTGKLTSNLMEAVAHIRSAPGLPAPDFQLINAPIFAFAMGEGTHPRPAFAILQSYWTPESRGSVLVRSANPRDAPAIQLNTVTAPRDLDAFVRAIRRTREIVAAEPLASAAAVEIQPGSHVNTDAEVKAWVRATVATTGHPACSAAMGTEPDSVLDERLRVRGVASLRVADTSALPRIPRANTNAPAIMVGERCADFILSEANSPPG
jgi:choline dehydrogenase-like flavoprotein